LNSAWPSTHPSPDPFSPDLSIKAGNFCRRPRRRAGTGAAGAGVAFARSERPTEEIRVAHSRLSSCPNSIVGRIASGGSSTTNVPTIPPRTASSPTSGRMLGGKADAQHFGFTATMFGWGAGIFFGYPLRSARRSGAGAVRSATLDNPDHGDLGSVVGRCHLFNRSCLYVRLQKHRVSAKSCVGQAKSE